jgi:hypothetical protein
VTNSRLFTLALSGWLVVVLASFGVRSGLVESPVSLAEALGWLFLGCAPAGVFLSLYRGGATPTVGRLLYDVEHSTAGSPSRVVKGSHAGRH